MCVCAWETLSCRQTWRFVKVAWDVCVCETHWAADRHERFVKVAWDVCVCMRDIELQTDMKGLSKLHETCVSMTDIELQTDMKGAHACECEITPNVWDLRGLVLPDVWMRSDWALQLYYSVGISDKNMATISCSHLAPAEVSFSMIQYSVLVQTHCMTILHSCTAVGVQ